MDYKKLLILILALVIIGSLYFLFKPKGEIVAPAVEENISTLNNADIANTHLTNNETPNIDISSSPIVSDAPLTTVIASGLSIPWDIAFLDDGYLITERIGNLVYLKKTGEKTSIKLPHPVPRGEGGLLGIVLHPNFKSNKYLYLYMTTSQGSNGTMNAVYRYTFDDNELKDEKIIIENIPGAIYHDGGRMEFGPDGYLYITTGDAQDSNIAQNKDSLGGKILRLHDDGKVPADNPFGNAVYSYGHRNPQGLAWDGEGRLWSTEHGRSGVTSGLDELNLIEKGKNYGWPTIEGDKTKEEMVNPAIHSGTRDTWAPASAEYLDGSIYFGGLKGEALYEAVLDGTSVKELKTHFKGQYGRIRTVRVGPDGMLYLTTSNKDGRGSPAGEDDRVIKVNPVKL